MFWLIKRSFVRIFFWRKNVKNERRRAAVFGLGVNRERVNFVQSGQKGAGDEGIFNIQ